MIRDEIEQLIRETKDDPDDPNLTMSKMERLYRKCLEGDEKPELMIKDGVLWYRDEDGEWQAGGLA